MARSNGGIIGKTNKASFGKCTVTSKTSSCSVTTQPGTRVVQAAIISGGGGAGGAGNLFTSRGGGGAGGLRNIEINVSGNTTYCAVIGAGGAGGPFYSNAASAGVASSFACVSSTGGGIGGG